MCCPQATAGLSAPGTDPRRRYLIKMQRQMGKENQGILEMIPPLRGGDFQGIAGLSSDDSLLVGVSTARERSFNKTPRAVKHRLDEPGQIIPQHGCVPALPASVSPGRGNFSRKTTKVVRAAQNQASVIAQRGLEVKLMFSTSGRGRNIFLDFPFYRSGVIRSERGHRLASD
jgi:hypothetical protein